MVIEDVQKLKIASRFRSSNQVLRSANFRTTSTQSRTLESYRDPSVVSAAVTGEFHNCKSSSSTPDPKLPWMLGSSLTQPIPQRSSPLNGQMVVLTVNISSQSGIRVRIQFGNGGRYLTDGRTSAEIRLGPGFDLGKR